MAHGTFKTIALTFSKLHIGNSWQEAAAARRRIIAQRRAILQAPFPPTRC